MFITIPLTLIVACATGIIVIVWRKFPYLKKLTTGLTQTSELQEASGPLFHEFFPELVQSFRNAELHKYQGMWLVEVEKFLRRLRVMSLRMDRASDSMIKKIRKSYLENNVPVATPEVKPEPVVADTPAPVVAEPKVNELDILRKEEYRLIIEIAKNPKDSRLYEALGDLYIMIGDWSDAKESLEAAQELDSTNESIKRKLSKVSAKINVLMPDPASQR